MQNAPWVKEDLPDAPFQTGMELNPELKRRLEAAGGGLEIAGSMISKVPSFIGGGFLGLMDPRHGGDPGKMAEQVKDYSAAIPSYNVKSESGKTGLEGINALRELVGETGGAEGALQTANEAAFDISTMMLPLGGRGRRITPKEQAWIEAKRSIENANKKSEFTYAPDDLISEVSRYQKEMPP